MIYLAKTWYRKARGGYLPIVAGWRAELVNDVDGSMIYSDAHETRRDALQDIAEQLKARGLSGRVRAM